MSKNIIICCDGTGNEPSAQNSNVVKLYSLIEKNPETQVTFYDPGIGTFGIKPYALYSEITGLGLSENIRQAYGFLMSHYKNGDKVFLFGFSRGAYTVRCLAGLLKKIGLLHKGNFNLLNHGINQYFDQENDLLTDEFKLNFSRECNVHFVGVWDTVSAFIPVPPSHKFKNKKLNIKIPFGYQALAIDEKRKNFRPEIWEEHDEELKNMEDVKQTIEQVWFAGVHSDVGGSNPATGLSDISLEWMIDNAKEQGLIMKKNYTTEINKDIRDRIDESYKGIWRLRSKFIREIPLGSKIHCSVLERVIREINNYEPSQLPKSPDEIRAKYQIIGDCKEIDE
jgi:uncharacterized protein (DUF2235 family)